MKMPPRLQAEERLGLIEAFGLGAGSYVQQERSEMLARLREKAFGESAPAVVRANPAQLGEMGFGVVLVPVEKAVSDV